MCTWKKSIGRFLHVGDERSELLQLLEAIGNVGAKGHYGLEPSSLFQAAHSLSQHGRAGLDFLVLLLGVVPGDRH
jgi:hypothetical protein